MNNNNITTQNRHIINQCRIYMQHTYLFEITLSDGTQIAQQIFEQHPLESLDHNPEHDWPRQSKSNVSSWKKYMDAIKRMFCKQNGKLHSPSGNWTRQSKNGTGDTTTIIKSYALGIQTNGQRISSVKELGITCGLNSKENPHNRQATNPP